MRRSSAKHRAAGLKAARTRARNKNRRSLIAKKAALTRRRGLIAKKAALTRRTNRWNTIRRTCI